ncbi:MAG: hypothetical protein ACXWT1_20415 [Methylobacter sp.]
MIAQLFRFEFGIPAFNKIIFTLRQFRPQVIQLHLIDQLFVGFHKPQCFMDDFAGSVYKPEVTFSLMMASSSGVCADSVKLELGSQRTQQSASQ